jgi:hypothetical protein
MPVPHSPDESDANTLPDPELNPLLNPLLAAHMGRWAEVYFTNPPEKREQAVSELLRELKNASPPEFVPVVALPDESARAETKTATVELLNPPPVTLEEPALTCGVCAYNNSAGQRFCGMCGALLQVSAEAPTAEAAPTVGASWAERSVGGYSIGGHSIGGQAIGGQAIGDAIEPAAISTGAGSGVRDSLEPVWRPLGNDLPEFGVEAEPLPNRSRLFVGVALAILLAVLGYMAWRGTEALSGEAASQSAPLRAIPATQPPAATPAPPPSSTGSALPASTPPVAEVQSQEVQNQSDTSAQKNQTAESQPAPRIIPVAAKSSSVAPAQGGADELAMAEKYLNGTPPITRNTGEAAQWLWKAVRKQNLEATMTLSDLYLRGDGVPKSCDQARLLLDAAARKGGKAAAERIRNLQAFGCQ